MRVILELEEVTHELLKQLEPLLSDMHVHTLGKYVSGDVEKDKIEALSSLTGIKIHEDKEVRAL